jgi:hypothetical protein
MLANRLTRPLRRLAAGAEAVGRGELGVQVPEDAPGEVGELQRSFNQMSSRLAALELERSRWLERENLAQLGDLSRGLAHTVRNPLNTLGLAIEELALTERPGRPTARGQIRRTTAGCVRSWQSVLRTPPLPRSSTSGAGRMTLARFRRGTAAVDGGEQLLPVRAVPSALRAAIANLVENGRGPPASGRGEREPRAVKRCLCGGPWARLPRHPNASTLRTSRPSSAGPVYVSRQRSSSACTRRSR